MPRNLDRRVEALSPVTDPRLRARLAEILDDQPRRRRARVGLGADGTWHKVPTVAGVDSILSSPLAATRPNSAGVATDGVAQLRAPLEQAVAHPHQHLAGRLLDALDPHQPGAHPRPGSSPRRSPRHRSCRSCGPARHRASPLAAGSTSPHGPADQARAPNDATPPQASRPITVGSSFVCGRPPVCKRKVSSRCRGDCVRMSGLVQQHR